MENEIRDVLKDLLSACDTPFAELSRQLSDISIVDDVYLHLGAPLPSLELTEKCVRSLREIAKRWNQPLPAVRIGPSHSTSREKVLDRIQSFLVSLGNTASATNVILLLKGAVTSSATSPTEQELERCRFIENRLQSIDEQNPASSHGECCHDDYFAMSFWYEASLILLFNEPFAPDFVRHRCRGVCKELTHLLPSLEDPPPEPARVTPIPPA